MKVEGRRNGIVSYEMVFWVVCWARVADVGRGAEAAAVGGYHSRETVGAAWGWWMWHSDCPAIPTSGIRPPSCEGVCLCVP